MDEEEKGVIISQSALSSGRVGESSGALTRKHFREREHWKGKYIKERTQISALHNVFVEKGGASFSRSFILSRSKMIAMLGWNLDLI